MNEADSVFANEDSVVEVPYVEPSFFESLNVKSMIPRSNGIRMNDMNNVMCYVNYDCSMCTRLCAMCKILSMMMHFTLME